jgi:Domain of unknown function (DUF5666)
LIRRHALALVLAVMAAAMPASLSAHPGHEHKLLGTVTAVAADQLTVKAKDGAAVTVHLDKDTKVSRDHKPAKAGDITTGMRVVVTAVTVKDRGADRTVARRIELGVTPAAR